MLIFKPSVVMKVVTPSIRLEGTKARRIQRRRSANAAGCGGTVGPSIQGDVIDYDEFLTGERKEGSYFSAWSFVQKSATGVMLLLTGFVLQVVEPHANGPGGEVPILLYSAERDEVRRANGRSNYSTRESLLTLCRLFPPLRRRRGARWWAVPWCR